METLVLAAASAIAIAFMLIFFVALCKEHHRAKEAFFVRISDSAQSGGLPAPSAALGENVLAFERQSPGGSGLAHIDSERTRRTRVK